MDRESNARSTASLACAVPSDRGNSTSSDEGLKSTHAKLPSALPGNVNNFVEIFKDGSNEAQMKMLSKLCQEECFLSALAKLSLDGNAIDKTVLGDIARQTSNASTKTTVDDTES